MKRNPVLKSIIVSVALSAVLAGCGSSSNSSDDTSNDTKVQSTKISGYAVDGYLKFATVCLDINKDGYCQDIEPMTSTKENGSFTLEIKPEVQKQDGFDEAMLLVYGGVDVDTGDDFKGKLLAPADSKEISVTPLTTIVAKMVQEDIKGKGDLSKDEIKQKIEDAKAKVAEALDIDVEDLTKDPVALKDTNPKLIIEALKIQKAIEAYKVDGDRDDIEKVYEQLAKHIKKADLKIEKKDAQEILKEVLKDSKYLDIADNIDDAFEHFDGDLQKVSHVTKEDIRKIKKDQGVKRSDSDWAKYKDYDKDKWADEFIKSDLEDIGIEDVSDEDIEKIKEKLGNGIKINPGIVKDLKEKFQDSDDGIGRQIFEKMKDFRSKNTKNHSDRRAIPSIKNPISKIWTDDSIIKSFANKTLYFVSSKEIDGKRVYSIQELKFDSDAVAYFNDEEERVEVDIYADKYGDELLPYIKIIKGNNSKSSVINRQTPQYYDFSIFDNDEFLYKSYESAKKRLLELESEDKISNNDNLDLNFYGYSGSFIYFQENDYIKEISFNEDRANIVLTDGSHIDAKWKIADNSMTFENRSKEFQLFLNPTKNSFKNGPSYFVNGDTIDFAIYYNGDIMNEQYKDKGTIKVKSIGF